MTARLAEAAQGGIPTQRLAVSQQEAADMVGVSLKAIKAAVRSGELRAKTRGPRTTRIPVVALATWFESWTDVVEDD